MNINELDYKKLRDDGFVKVDNFLNEEQTNKIKDIVKFYNSAKGQKETHFCMHYVIMALIMALICILGF